MVISKTEIFIVSVLLAVLEAVQQIISISDWIHALVTCCILFFGILGVKAATPAQIAAKIPQHIAALVGAFVSAVSAFQQIVPSMPKVVHIVIGVILVLAATLGIQVTKLAASAKATLELQKLNKPA